MLSENLNSSRRTFVKDTFLITVGVGLSTSGLKGATDKDMKETDPSLYEIGPRKGYDKQVGTLLSMMNMMRTWVVRSVEHLSVAELDFQLDDQANSIGAMLWHLAATEKYYQLNTFDGLAWNTWGDDIKQEWDTAMSLGFAARKKIKGYDIDFYLTKLERVRKVTKQGFAERDDQWLLKSDPNFWDQPTNNYAKWFHVCEHESNHNGQIKFIKKRIQ